MRKNLIIAAMALFPTFVFAEAMRFDDAWKDFTFRKYAPTTYAKNGASVQVRGTGTSSMLYTFLPEADRDVTHASWIWSTLSSVPVTDLGQKGGDDRNLALYFVFTDAGTAANITPDSNPAKMLSRKARILIYAWGDNKPIGTSVANPYDTKRGRILLLRPAGTGTYTENRDLVADYKAAFGEAPEKLIAVAIAADGDDTGTALNGTLKDLVLK